MPGRRVFEQRKDRRMRIEKPRMGAVHLDSSSRKYRFARKHPNWDKRMVYRGAW